MHSIMASTSTHSSSMAATADDRTAKNRHEDAFVQPSSYVRPRGLSHPMAPAAAALSERAIDHEERQGLVSSFFSFFFFVLFCPPSRRELRRQGEEETRGGLEMDSGISVLFSFSIFCSLICFQCLKLRTILLTEIPSFNVARHPQFPQSPQQLRRPPPQFPSYYLRYLVVG